jgi:sec-independent protein translocase protein TatC
MGPVIAPAEPMSTVLEQDDEPLADTILTRVRELRSRVLKAVLCYVAVAVCLLPFADTIFGFFADPIIAKLPEGTSMIAKQVAAPFFAPLKAALLAALFITMPLLLYHFWKAVEPWVPQRGRRVALPFLAASTLLFYIGVAFAYFVIMPIVFGFFVDAAPANVEVRPDIDAYLSFAIGLLLAFGIAFETPVALVIIVWTGIASRQQLAGARPYVLLVAFTAGMFLTPPDMFSQTLLAIPMYLLFEMALFFCARFLPKAEPPPE